jgi:methylthioribose-1-phosphate isomerase
VGADEALRQGGDFRARVERGIERLARTRPTAVNLFWALNRMRKVLEGSAGQPAEAARGALLKEANAIFEEDRKICRQIGRNGMELLRDGATVITHCNAGGLATADYGTALAVIYAAAEAGRRVGVYADETRPLLQGSRLTAWELRQSGIDVTVICDSMAGTVMRQKGVDCVIVGADRIAANGDVANKIGTYSLALLARAHGIPFYVAAPVSTVDISLSSGEEIPIEERKPTEVTEGFGRRTAPEGVKVFNPAFDVTPHTLITGIVSERGIARPPFEPTLRAWCE